MLDTYGVDTMSFTPSKSILQSLKHVQPLRSLSHVTKTKTPSQNPSTTHNTGFTHDETLRIPQWGSYASSSKRQTNQVFAYFMVGAYTLGSVVGAKATVQGVSKWYSGMALTMQANEMLKTFW